jgi:hypothetical protein
MTGIASLAFIDEERILAASSDPGAAYFTGVLPRKIALEVAYLERRTWRTDLAILALTPLAGLSRSLRQAAVAWLVPSWPAGDLGAMPADSTTDSRPALSLSSSTQKESRP